MLDAEPAVARVANPDSKAASRQIAAIFVVVILTLYALSVEPAQQSSMNELRDYTRSNTDLILKTSPYICYVLTNAFMSNGTRVDSIIIRLKYKLSVRGSSERLSISNIGSNFKLVYQNKTFKIIPEIVKLKN